MESEPANSLYEKTLAAVRLLSAGVRTKPKPAVLVANEPVKLDPLVWHCRDCYSAKRNSLFQLPVGSRDAAACIVCKSHNVFDCNVTPTRVPGCGPAPEILLPGMRRVMELEEAATRQNSEHVGPA